jgi:hypothetical protein
MQIRVQVIIESDDGTQDRLEEVLHIQRHTLRSEELGLTLAEAKEMLASVQHTFITAQARAYIAQHHACSHCGTPRSSKDQRTIVFRTLFGTVRVSSPRFYTCRCQPQTTASWSPLAACLPERTTPELLYLEAKFAALMSYGLTVDLLADVLSLKGASVTGSICQSQTGP